MTVRMAMAVSTIVVVTVWTVPKVINKLVNVTEDVIRDISTTNAEKVCILQSSLF